MSLTLSPFHCLTQVIYPSAGRFARPPREGAHPQGPARSARARCARPRVRARLTSHASSDRGARVAGHGRSSPVVPGGDHPPWLPGPDRRDAMSIPWQRHMDEHARTVEIRVSGTHRPSGGHVIAPGRTLLRGPVPAADPPPHCAHGDRSRGGRRRHAGPSARAVAVGTGDGRPRASGAGQPRRACQSVGGALRAWTAASRSPPRPCPPPLPDAQKPVTHGTGTMRRQERTP